MARKRTKVIPKNVLAQEKLRRKYVEEPWPQKLILVKSTLDEGGDIRIRGEVTKLFYNLSYPYLYVDERDLYGLGNMVTKENAEKEVNDAKAVSRSKGSVSALDAIANAGQAKSTGKRKRGRPRKNSRSQTNDSSDTIEDGRVLSRDND